MLISTTGTLAFPYPKAGCISILRMENVSDRAGGDTGLTGFFFNFSFLDTAERLGGVS